MSVHLVGAIETLASHHDRRQFSSGDQELDTYLKRFARQHASSTVSRTYVAVKGATILGFYSMAMAAIRKDHLPPIYPVCAENPAVQCGDSQSAFRKPLFFEPTAGYAGS